MLYDPVIEKKLLSATAAGRVRMVMAQEQTSADSSRKKKTKNRNNVTSKGPSPEKSENSRSPIYCCSLGLGRQARASHIHNVLWCDSCKSYSLISAVSLNEKRRGVIIMGCIIISSQRGQSFDGWCYFFTSACFRVLAGNPFQVLHHHRRWYFSNVLCVWLGSLCVISDHPPFDTRVLWRPKYGWIMNRCLPYIFPWRMYYVVVCTFWNSKQMLSVSTLSSCTQKQGGQSRNACFTSS